MLYELLITLYIFVCILLTLIILIQKGKGSMGLGSIGGGSQMLFGGSGGQDIFQKITWVLAAIFIAGSLLLTLMRSHQSQTLRYAKPASSQTQPLLPQQAPEQKK